MRLLKRKITLWMGVLLLFVGCVDSYPDRNLWSTAMSKKNIGLAYLYRNDFISAANIFEEVTKIVPQEPLGYANLALTFLKQRDLDGANESINRALKLAPRDGEILSIYSDVVAAQGESEEALSILTEAVALNPSNVVLRYKYLTEIKRIKGQELQLKFISKHLRRMLDYEKDNLAVLVELNKTLIRIGQIPEALEGYGHMEILLAPVEEEIRTWLNQTVEALKNGDLFEAESTASILGNLLIVDPAYRKSRDRLGDPSQQSYPLSKFRTGPSNLTNVAKIPSVKMKFVDVTHELFDMSLLKQGPWRDVALTDVDGDSFNEIVLADSNRILVVQKRVDTWHKIANPFDETPNGSISKIATVDFDNDGYFDIHITGTEGSQLYMNTGSGGYTLSQTLSHSFGPLLFMSHADYDHDGDLDLMASEKGQLKFYRNVEAGVFEDATEYSGFRETRRETNMNQDTEQKPYSFPEQSLVWGDFDLDGAIDIISLDDNGSPQFYRNMRQGRWIDWTKRFGENLKGNVNTLVTADFNNDGKLDVYLMGENNCQLFWNNNGQQFKRNTVNNKLPNICSGFKPSLARTIDFDNDGFIDIVLAGRGIENTPGLRLYRNLGDGSLEDQTILLPKLPTIIEDLETADLDHDGDIDLVMLSEGRLIFLTNEGGNNNRWLGIKLAAALEGSGKNNFFGIGSTIEILSGTHYQSLQVTSSITHVGLGNRERADVIRVLWSNGVPQNRINPNPQEVIVEAQRLKGSCPSLYTWNGNNYEFVTHLMTRSAIGAMTETGAPAYPNAAKDFVKIRGDQLREKNGKYFLRVVEELWDAVFMDKMELIVIDHPITTEVYVDEKYLPPPYPDLEIHTVTDLRLPIAAWDHYGNDILPQLTRRDSLYFGNFTPGEFQGVPELHSITLDLGNLKTAKSIHLYLGGWIMPVEPSSNLALSQRKNVSIVPPFLEVPDKAGNWQTAIPYTGFPSGEHKTIFIDLTDRFITDDYRIRLTTNLELYWSEAFFTVDEPPSPKYKIYSLQPMDAHLNYRGYSREYQLAPYGPFVRDYETLSTDPQWLPFDGYRTKFGEVTELLQSSDNHYVIYSSGEEIAVTFDGTTLPKLQPGWARDFVLHTDGWLKEGDLNTATAATIEPLPYHGMERYPNYKSSHFPNTPDNQRYRETFNNRWVSQQRFRESIPLYGLKR